MNCEKLDGHAMSLQRKASTEEIAAKNQIIAIMSSLMIQLYSVHITHRSLIIQV